MIIIDNTAESQIFTLLLGYSFGYIILHKNRISMNTFHENTPSTFNKHGKQLLLDSSRDILEPLPPLKTHETIMMYIYNGNTYEKFDYTNKNPNIIKETIQISEDGTIL
jgi:hypothetical protein